MEAGQEDGLMPAGLGARDTLRFEAGLCLYGHELGPDINPLEARLGFVVKLDKDDFIGKDSLVKVKAEGLSKRLVGLKVLGRGVARQGYPILNAEDQEVGYVTSGTLSPTLKQSMGLGFVPPALAKPGTQLQILVRQRKLNAEVVKTPFYKREG